MCRLWVSLWAAHSLLFNAYIYRWRSHSCRSGGGKCLSTLPLCLSCCFWWVYHATYIVVYVYVLHWMLTFCITSVVLVRKITVSLYCNECLLCCCNCLMWYCRKCKGDVKLCLQCETKLKNSFNQTYCYLKM